MGRCRASWPCPVCMTGVSDHFSIKCSLLDSATSLDSNVAGWWCHCSQPSKRPYNKVPFHRLGRLLSCENIKLLKLFSDKGGQKVGGTRAVCEGGGNAGRTKPHKRLLSNNGAHRRCLPCVCLACADNCNHTLSGVYMML